MKFNIVNIILTQLNDEDKNNYRYFYLLFFSGFLLIYIIEFFWEFDLI